jgi:hypothetical protein
MALRLRAAALTVEPPRKGRGHADLVDMLVGQVPPGADGPDLVLLAYAAPDVTSPKTVVSYLNMLTGGSAHSFALSGQGLGAPFTALRIASAYERTGRCSEFLLAVVEQGAPAHRDRAHAPRTDSGVLLAFDRSPGFGVLTSVYSAEYTEELGPRLAALTAGAGRLLVVLGPGADPAVLPPGRADTHQVPAGNYCTSVWLALAGHLPKWQEAYDAIALCDTDPRFGTSYLAVLLDQDHCPAGVR